MLKLYCIFTILSSILQGLGPCKDFRGLGLRKRLFIFGGALAG
jgi:hypothetical protein